MMSILLWIIENAGSLFTLIKGVIDFIRGIKDPALHDQAMSELTSAFAIAKATGSTEALKNIAQKYCASGVACEAETKS